MVEGSNPFANAFIQTVKKARSKGGLLFFTALCSVSRKDCGMVEGSNPFTQTVKKARSKGGLLFFTALCSVSRKDCGMVEGSNPFANAFIQTVKKLAQKAGFYFLRLFVACPARIAGWSKVRILSLMPSSRQ
jgi:hypothetical protein